MTVPDVVQELWSPETIRARSGNVLRAGETGALEWFSVELGAMDAVADRVTDITRAKYIDLDIPYHGRWGHFRTGGVDRVADFDARIATLDAVAQGVKRFDLVITSVLLDAGAGPDWSYVEDGESYDRSEGLAVASYRMFTDGRLDDLANLDAATLAEGFQVTGDNPLVGLEGRLALMRRLGETAKSRPDLFPTGTPGGLFVAMTDRAEGGKLDARQVLALVLEGLGPIWPGRITLHDVNLGDVWRHPHAGGAGESEGLVPFHKLSQWLTYSLLEPLERFGLEMTHLDRLTGLAEYRNGGLFVDGGVLVPKRNELLTEAHAPGSEAIVEWRALTVALLDRIAPMVRERLGLEERDFPLAKVLEGGTWHAGRAMAKERRADGSPPIRIASDGTVF